jgi:hypothetical protein
LLDWLRFLCLNSECRGLGGHELIGTELLNLTLIARRGAGTPASQADVLRAVIHGILREENDANLATLHLLGMTPAMARQPRPLRRQAAADIYGQPLDTFQKRYELLLLRDVAETLWGLEVEARTDGV